MKRLLTLTLLVLCAVTTAAQSGTGTLTFLGEFERSEFLVRDGVSYRLRYSVSPYGTVPATVGGRLHSDATLTVYRIFGGGVVQVSAPLRVQYVEGGCFDADPEQHLTDALKPRTRPRRAKEVGDAKLRP